MVMKPSSDPRHVVTAFSISVLLVALYKLVLIAACGLLVAFRKLSSKDDGSIVA